MKTASLKELKNELSYLTTPELIEIMMRLGKFKKDNKELLSYLLFEAHDEHQYVKGVMSLLNGLFDEVNTTSVFFAKKSVRKIIRVANKYIRYTENPVTEVEILIYVCKKMKSLPMEWESSAVMRNMYQNLLKKIKKSMAPLHEELQYDFIRQMHSFDSNIS